MLRTRSSKHSGLVPVVPDSFVLPVASSIPLYVLSLVGHILLVPDSLVLPIACSMLQPLAKFLTFTPVSTLPDRPSLPKL